MIECFCVDSSALIAIIKGEPEEDRFAAALTEGTAVIGWPTVFEVRLWLLRQSRSSESWLDDWLQTAQAVAWTAAHEQLAADAYRRFGKGLHPASLNFGDCMAYATAVVERVPLLFKGSDFGLTDIAIHPASAVIPTM